MLPFCEGMCDYSLCVWLHIFRTGFYGIIPLGKSYVKIDTIYVHTHGCLKICDHVRNYGERFVYPFHNRNICVIISLRMCDVVQTGVAEFKLPSEKTRFNAVFGLLMIMTDFL